MLITHTNLSLSAKHELETVRRQETRLAAPPRAEASFGKLLERELRAIPTSLLAVEAPPTKPTDTSATAPEETPFKALMDLLFGQAPGTEPAIDAGTTAPPRLLPQGPRVMTLTHVRETESCSFAARGNVCLADGTQRQFEVAYQLERSEETTQASASGLRDPLVVDLAAPTRALAAHNVKFDLDSDGKAEDVRLPGGNTALLFIDRNHNGMADDGRELFGPQSGNGFDELAQLDTDGNGWIDEGDAAYADLMLWQPGDDGNGGVRSLAAAEIGALATSHAATPFTFKEDGAVVGQMRASSVWLGEHGGVGSVRQIDVASTQGAQ